MEAIRHESGLHGLGKIAQAKLQKMTNKTWTIKIIL